MLTSVGAWFFGTLGYAAIAGVVALAVAAHFFSKTVSLIAWVIAVAALALSSVGKDAVIASARADLAQEQTVRANLERDLAKSDSKARDDAEELRKAKAGAVAAVDERTQKELTDARKENDRLRAAVRVSADSLRIVGAYCPSTSNPVPASTSASSVGDAAAATTPELRERVLDHREALIEAEKQIEYLQGYARALSTTPAAPR